MTRFSNDRLDDLIDFAYNEMNNNKECAGIYGDIFAILKNNKSRMTQGDGVPAQSCEAHEAENGDYRVEWVIDAFQVNGPIEAARYAQHMQQTDRQGYWAGCFYAVRAADGKRFRIDLDEARQGSKR